MTQVILCKYNIHVFNNWTALYSVVLEPSFYRHL